MGRLLLTVVRKWLFKPLFDAVNGGMRLEAGRSALFTTTMYASLYSLLQKLIMHEGSTSSTSTFAIGRRSPAATSAGPPIDMRTVQAEELARNMTEVVVPALAACQGTALFDEFKRRWEDHKTITEWVRRLFKALDSETVRGKADTLTSHSIKVFKEFAFDKRKGSIGGHVLVRDAVRWSPRAGALTPYPPRRCHTTQAQVELERDGTAIDRSQVKSVLELFQVMGVCLNRSDFADRKAVEAVTKAASVSFSSADVYVKDFEEPFIAASRAWYRTRGNEWAALPSTDYVRRVAECIRSETDRVNTMMHIKTLPKLLAELNAHMIAPHVETCINKEGSGMLALLRRGDAALEEIGIMYTVLSRVPDGAKKMATVLKVHIDEMVRRARCVPHRRAIAA